MDNKDAYIEHLENTIVNLNETISGLQNLSPRMYVVTNVRM